MSATRQLGLIGYPLSHSFSKKYFANKFAQEGIPNYHYELYPLERIKDFPLLLKKVPNLVGINVTIPYKQQVMPYLDDIDEEAAKVGAVNTIKIENGRLKGYNTDIFGFESTLLSLIATANKPSKELKALILGTGGAAKAVHYVLDKLDIFSQFVSRTSKEGLLTYEALHPNLFEDYQIIINTTPLGMSPNIHSCPAIPYDAINKNYFLYDLVYNPEQTVFLAKGKEQGAAIRNGHKMLILQAEKAWNIWTGRPICV